MDRKEFLRCLEENRLPSVLLFEGDEMYLKQTALDALRKAVLPEGMEDLNETVMEVPDTDALIAAAETLPFLSDRRLVIVRDHPDLTGRSEGDDRLVSYLSSVPETCILLFFCTKKPDGRKKLYNAVKKAGAIVTFAQMADIELTHFVTQIFRKYGLDCNDRTADQLIFTCGTDTALLLSEAEKIASLCAGSGSVSPENIRALATPSAECTVFEMVDAVVSGQEARAFQLLRNQLRTGTDRVYILAMLLRQYRLLQHIKIMQYEKRNPDFIRNALGIPSFAVGQYTRQASLYTGSQVKQAVRICYQAEYAVKSGRLNQEGLPEAVILKLFALKKKD